MLECPPDMDRAERAPKAGCESRNTGAREIEALVFFCESPGTPDVSAPAIGYPSSLPVMPGCWPAGQDAHRIGKIELPSDAFEAHSRSSWELA